MCVGNFFYDYNVCLKSHRWCGVLGLYYALSDVGPSVRR
jgi:hypothetical protein